MAIWDFRPKGDLWTGVAVGAGLLAAPVVIPLAWSATRPVLKAILKGGFMLYETGRQIVGESTEELERGTAIGVSWRVPGRRMRKDEEIVEEVIGQVRGVEERDRGGGAMPKQPGQKQRKKPDKKK